MGELKPDVDLQALNEWFADIPPGPYDALNTTGGWEVRQIDTDPANKHHWPFRLCSSITGQTAGCDAAVFSFIAGVINAWPHLLDADRTEGRGEGQPVAWAYEYTNHLKGDRAPGGWLRAVAFEAPTRARVNAGFARNVQPLYASPIREPEISKPDRELAAREAFQVLHPYENWNDLDERYDPRGGYHPMQIKAFEVADAILNLAPVGGRGEESSSGSDLSPASRSQDQHSDGGEG